MAQTIKGIFLDLDDTLYSYPPCNEAGKQAVFAHLVRVLHKPLEAVERAFTHGREQTKTLLKTSAFELAASHSRLLYCQKAIEELTGKTNSVLTLACEKIFWDTFQNTMKLFPGAHNFLERAKASKKILVIVTDMTVQAQLQKLVKLGIDDRIDYVVSSEESGREKPEPVALRLALQKTHCAPHEVVMVGEDEKRDIAAAHAAGITPIAIHKQPSDPSVLYAENFNTLTTLLGL